MKLIVYHDRPLTNDQVANLKELPFTNSIFLYNDSTIVVFVGKVNDLKLLVIVLRVVCPTLRIMEC